MSDGILRIGTSGWQYDHWKGDFYPEDLPKTRWFDHYADHFDAVEINNTFYNLPAARTFDAWRDDAPPGFRFILKFSRYGTHMKKLKDPAEVIDNFLERAEHLRTFLGPILVQLPPNWRANPERLAGFLSAAPRRHRWAVEVRDPSWLCDAVFAVLREHNVALCIHDMIEDPPWRVTADWLYLRYHAGEGHDTGYPHQKLSADARRIHEHLAAGRDVYAFFNNDVGCHAPRDAADLRRFVTD